MRKEDLIEISIQHSQLLEYLKTLYQQLGSLKVGENFFDADFELATSETLPIWLSRLASIDSTIQAFSKSKHRELIPYSRIKNFESSINKASNYINTLNNKLHGYIEIGLSTYDYKNHTGRTLDNRHIDLSELKSLDDIFETILESYFDALVVLKPTKSDLNFDHVIETMSGLLSKTNQDVGILNNEITTVQGKSKKIETLLNQAEISGVEIERLLSDSANDRKTIIDYMSEGSEKKAAIDAVFNETINLEEQVKEYRSKFSSFQKQLNDRELFLKQGQKSLDELRRDLIEENKNIQETIATSEKMLTGATVAGLASEFGAIRSQLDHRLHRVLIGFYVGLGFLFISAVPLMAPALWPMIKPFLSLEYSRIDLGFSLASTDSLWKNIGQIVTRSIFLLPSIWFVSFNAKRYSQLFQLREHYAYKYSLAVSVDGFKKQAKSYEDEIVKMVFEKIAFNPANKIAPRRYALNENNDEPLIDSIWNKLSKRIDDNTPSE